MALWNGLGQAATVAQLVGADVSGLISLIVQSALTARQNKSECEQLARRVLMIAQLLPHVQEPEAAQALAGLSDTLRDAHDFVASCQGRSAAYQFVMAGRTAERFREVQSKIDSYLILFPVISHIGITRRLERIYNVLVPDESTRGQPPYPLPQLQDVPPHGTEEFRFAEIVTATNNFDTMIGLGSYAKVYRGRLHDGREVSVKRIMNLRWETYLLAFRAELDILPRLRHKHIIRLLGSCVSKDKCLLNTSQNKKKRMLTWRRKEPEELEGLIVYEYMENGTLSDHLLTDQCSSTPSPVTMSWKMRINVLLGVSRAIEHLQCHANPPIIHRDVKPSNILFNANWVPHLSDFGLSMAWDMASKESGMQTDCIAGTMGYIAPEVHQTCCVKPASDVYSLGVLMLVVLTGKGWYFREHEMYVSLTCFAIPIIEAGNIGELLDRRPVPEPTPWQMQVLKRVAQIAGCCVKLDWKARPAISDIVANLEMAHQLMCRDEPGSVDEPGLWPFLVEVEESPDSPDVQSDQESEVLEEGR